MANALGNFVDVRLCCNDWERLSTLVHDQCGIGSPDRQIQDGGECFIEFTELAFVHWQCLKRLLDARNIRYDYRDLSEELPYWRNYIID